MPRRPHLVALVTIGLVALSLILQLPPARVAAPPSAPDDRVVAGAFHVHTDRSDGLGSFEDVAAAARRAGLDFVIVSDHGDATEPRQPPAYIDGVLCLDAVEISTRHGHYIAIGLPSTPFPLAGEGRDVVADVRRFGGFGVVAHPMSPKPELRWTEDRAVRVDGIEWINADSEWRDESNLTLLRGLLAYPFRPVESVASLFDRPTDDLREWEARLADHPVVALPGTDAHGGIRRNDDLTSTSPTPRRVGVPGYAAALGAFSLRLQLDEPLTGDPVTDGRLVEAAVRSGAAFTVIDGLAQPGRIHFEVSSGTSRARLGEQLRTDDPIDVVAHVDLAAPSDLVLIRDGVETHHSPGPDLNYRIDPISQPTWLRLEARRPGESGMPSMPWVVTNAIYATPSGWPIMAKAESAPGEPPPTDTAEPAQPLSTESTWVIEADPSSAGTLNLDAGDIEFRHALGSDASRPPFVAIQHPIDLTPAARALRFTARADRPLRLSAQLRSSPDGARWQRSVFVDTMPAVHTVALADMRPADPGAPTTSRPDTTTDTLLFVLDTVNSSPGDAGTVWISDVRVLMTPDDQVRTPSSR